MQTIKSKGGTYDTAPRAQHTPGPWELRGSYVMKGGRAIACCDYQQTSLGGSKAANARLIAAAPELLEACTALARLGIEKCSRCDGTGGRGDDPTTACGQCGGTGEETCTPHPDDIRAAQRAIAKAKGEA